MAVQHCIFTCNYCEASLEFGVLPLIWASCHFWAWARFAWAERLMSGRWVRCFQYMWWRRALVCVSPPPYPALRKDVTGIDGCDLFLWRAKGWPWAHSLMKATEAMRGTRTKFTPRPRSLIGPGRSLLLQIPDTVTQYPSVSLSPCFLHSFSFFLSPWLKLSVRSQTSCWDCYLPFHWPWPQEWLYNARIK